MPYPADYGGVFDLFYKIKSLHKTGIKIHLHCFEYGRGQQLELEKYCATVNYYDRSNPLISAINRLPYIVSSRRNNELLKNLSKDDYPVLLEGIHCTYLLHMNLLLNRKVIVRLHNVEYEYYRELSGSTRNILKKAFYSIESLKLKNYEREIANKAMFLTVNEKDRTTYQEEFYCKEIELLPVFLPFQSVDVETGVGNYCLYQGNLSVSENEKAVIWLLNNVFIDLDVEFIIAGKNPSDYLKSMVSKNILVKLIPDPSNEEMSALIKNAQIHLLPSFNVTGIKIKLLHALFNGRFIVTNQATVEGTGLEMLCQIVETPAEYKKAIKNLLHKTLNAGMLAQRNALLKNKYDNDKNARNLLEILFNA